MIDKIGTWLDKNECQYRRIAMRLFLVVYLAVISHSYWTLVTIGLMIGLFVADEIWGVGNGRKEL